MKNVNNLSLFKSDIPETGSLEYKSTRLLKTILDYYPGTTEERIQLAENHLEDLLFVLKNQKNNLFNNDSRKLYQIVNYSLNYVLPSMALDIVTRRIGGPYKLNEKWN